MSARASIWAVGSDRGFFTPSCLPPVFFEVRNPAATAAETNAQAR